MKKDTARKEVSV